MVCDWLFQDKKEKKKKIIMDIEHCRFAKKKRKNKKKFYVVRSKLAKIG